MNKAELVNFVANESGVSKKDAGVIVTTVLDGICDGLIKDGRVTLVGFGTFTVVPRKARVARNPQTGEEINVPEKNVPKFKPSPVLKEQVN